MVKGVAFGHLLTRTELQRIMNVRCILTTGTATLLKLQQHPIASQVEHVPCEPSVSSGLLHFSTQPAHVSARQSKQFWLMTSMHWTAQSKLQPATQRRHSGQVSLTWYSVSCKKRSSITKNFLFFLFWVFTWSSSNVLFRLYKNCRLDHSTFSCYLM